MENLKRIGKFILGFAICAVMTGCGTGRINYGPNSGIYLKPHYDKNVVVMGFADSRPVWEKNNSDPDQTKDSKCRENISVGITSAIQQDVAASGIFRTVLPQQASGSIQDTDAILKGEIFHFSGDQYPNILIIPMIPTFWLGSLFWMPFSNSDFDIEIFMMLADPKNGEKLWQYTIDIEWTKGWYNIVERGEDFPFLYTELCEALKEEMKKAMADMDATLRRSWTPNE